ncbi:MAG TPA: hypothetical protein VLT45_22490 [Kofleriaceae bacterium]|nr:hypothetical protein [Kofleriaceae bacterium]
MAAQFERIIRSVKQSMNYRGSYSTRDILGALVTRWVQSGEWQRLRDLPAGERRIGQSVRRFLLDRIGQIRRRGTSEAQSPDEIVLPDDATLADMVELAELRAWMHARIEELERGELDPRVRIRPAELAQVGAALRLHLAGLTQRQIASELGISLAVANKRIVDGTNLLVVLQGIEQGIGTRS